MPKLKTHRGAAKRFKRKPNGTYKCRRAFRNHILTKKTTKQKRRLRTADLILCKSNEKTVDRMIIGS